MRIGILTFHRALNVGAMLQAWALQKYLSDIGFQAEVIDYGCIGCPKRFCIGRRTLRGFIGAVCRTLNSVGIEGWRRTKYEKFLAQNIRLSKRIPRSQLRKLDYDAIVCGSDLIWNMDRNEGDETYFLDFAGKNVRKISYAPSFGFDLIVEKQILRMRSLLSDYYAISVRETQSLAICASLGIKAELVSDPAFLVDLASIEKLEKVVRGVPKKYILLYVICGHPYAHKIAQRISQRESLPVIYYLGGNQAKWVCRNQRGALLDVGPSEFLYLVHHATGVVTNSFHGMVFSLRYHVSPYITLNGTAADARMTDVLSACGLEEYGISSETVHLPGMIDDWTASEAFFVKCKMKACSFLSRALT